MQKVGLTNNMIEVEGHVRYVHIDHLRQWDARSMSESLPTPEHRDIPIAPYFQKELTPPRIPVTQQSNAVETAVGVSAPKDEEQTPPTT